MPAFQLSNNLGLPPPKVKPSIHPIASAGEHNASTATLIAPSGVDNTLAVGRSGRSPTGLPTSSSTGSPHGSIPADLSADIR
ncbi:MAG: hypothetical protein F6K65_42050, partial [Moorea sp. SIO3C2]|nr:hypothetical protein [Moorena sp. SIO3C2]